MKIKLKSGGYVVNDGIRTVAINDNERIVLDHAIAEGIKTGIFDADGAVFFQRELERIKARSYDVKYAALKAREIFPVSNETGPGVESITYRSYDSVGMAKIISSYAKDLPRADVKGREVSIPVRSVGSSYGYTVDEIAAAALTGRPLDSKRSDATIRAIEETVNRVAFFGDSESGLGGFFDNTNIPTGAVADNAGSTSKLWVNKTPQEILDDVNALCNSIFTVTKMVHRPNKLMLPTSQWAYITETPRSSTTDTTIANYLATNSPFLNSVDDIIPLNECAAANNPNLAADAMVAMEQSPEVMELEIPVETEFMAAQLNGFEYTIPAKMRLAGLNVYYPLAISIGTGI